MRHSDSNRIRRTLARFLAAPRIPPAAPVDLHATISTEIGLDPASGPRDPLGRPFVPCAVCVVQGLLA
jgi:hypothetical protein